MEKLAISITGSRRVFGARFEATVNLSVNLRQTHNVGATLAALAGFAADISTTPGIEIGASFYAPVAFTGNVSQISNIGAVYAIPVSFAGNVTVTAEGSPLRSFVVGDVQPGLYPDQLYGRDLTLSPTISPEAFAMQ